MFLYIKLLQFPVQIRGEIQIIIIIKSLLFPLRKDVNIHKIALKSTMYSIYPTWITQEKSNYLTSIDLYAIQEKQAVMDGDVLLSDEMQSTPMKSLFRYN